MLQIDTDTLNEINERLSNIAQNTSPIVLTPKAYHQELGYIDIEYMREPVSDNLQMEVVKAINPLRDGLRANDKERLKSAAGRERDNIEKYGYRGVGELFAPHITITRFKDRLPIDSAGLLSLDYLMAKFTKLGIFEMGDNGTCVRKIAEFKLEKI